MSGRDDYRILMHEFVDKILKSQQDQQLEMIKYLYCENVGAKLTDVSVEFLINLCRSEDHNVWLELLINNRVLPSYSEHLYSLIGDLTFLVWEETCFEVYTKGTDQQKALILPIVSKLDAIRIKRFYLMFRARQLSFDIDKYCPQSAAVILPIVKKISSQILDQYDFLSYHLHPDVAPTNIKTVTIFYKDMPDHMIMSFIDGRVEYFDTKGHFYSDACYDEHISDFHYLIETSRAAEIKIVTTSDKVISYTSD